jgi:hypothetical protein
MHEYMSLKVSSAEHADLATQLTTLSTQGWNVVNIVSTGTELIAYVSRPQSAEPTVSSTSTASNAEASTGWASVQTAQVSVPQSSPAQASPAVPADWYPDPSRRYEYRYWDGTKWTDNVSRAGVTYKDPPIP